MLKSQKGFTLIELLIVIVILGVLAVAIVPNIGSFMVSGDVGAANVELAGARTAIAAYMSENEGNIPVLVDGVTLDEAAITVYVANDIKGLYKLSSTGVIVDADNGDWTNKIRWNDVQIKWELNR